MSLTQAFQNAAHRVLSPIAPINRVAGVASAAIATVGSQLANHSFSESAVAIVGTYMAATLGSSLTNQFCKAAARNKPAVLQNLTNTAAHVALIPGTAIAVTRVAPSIINMF